MKKLLTLLILLAVPLIAGSVFAAGTVTVTKDVTRYVGSKPSVRTIVLTCVGDATNGSIPDTTLYNITGMSKPLPGWYLLRVRVKSLTADADVSDNADVYIKEDGTDLLNGQGVDQLDNATNNYIRLTAYDPIAENPVLDVDNQSEASGEYTVTLILGF